MDAKTYLESFGKCVVYQPLGQVFVSSKKKNLRIISSGSKQNKQFLKEGDHKKAIGAKQDKLEFQKDKDRDDVRLYVFILIEWLRFEDPTFWTNLLDRIENTLNQKNN